MLRAALVSAVLFGALHVSLGEAASAVQAADFVAVAQTACKPVQAALFGLFMAAMYFGTRNLWTLVAVHAAFNFLYAGPQLLAETCSKPTLPATRSTSFCLLSRRRFWFPRLGRRCDAFRKIQRTCNFSLSRSMNSGIMFNRFDKKPLLCGRGGIGRRVRFRSVWGQPHGGSSPLARTI